MSGDNTAAATNETPKDKTTEGSGKRKPYVNGVNKYVNRQSSGPGGVPYYNPYYNQAQFKFLYYDDPKYQCQFCSFKNRKVEDMSNHYKEKHDYILQKTAQLEKACIADTADASMSRHSLIFSPSNYIFISNPGEYLLDVNEENQDGVLLYIPHFLDKKDADDYLHTFKSELPWKQLEAVNKRTNKNVKESRLSCYYGPDYEYGPIKWQDAKEFNSHVSKLKGLVEEKAHTTFNSALGILYRTGRDHMGWHSDDEPELGKYPTIASVSFGSTRYFEFSRNGDSTKLVRLALKHGDLLVSSGCIQQKWKHGVPRDPDVLHCRINITFRNIDPALRVAHKEAKEAKAAASKAGKGVSAGDA